MKNLDVKELLELFAPAMVNRNKLYFRKEISDIVPIAEQGKFVKKYKNNVTCANGVYTVSENTGDITSVPAYNYFVVYERPLIEENQKRIRKLKFFFEGFETYGELKQRIQDKNFDTGLFIVYIKDYIGYRMTQFNVFYDEEFDKWTDLYIPCLGEIYDVQIAYDNDDKLPAPIKQACLLLIGDFYQNRENNVFTSVTDLPHSYEYTDSPQPHVLPQPNRNGIPARRHFAERCRHSGRRTGPGRLHGRDSFAIPFPEPYRLHSQPTKIDCPKCEPDSHSADLLPFAWGTSYRGAWAL